MRIFQNSGIYPAYRVRAEKITREARTFETYRDSLLADRWGASHLLLPILERHTDGFLAHGNDRQSQLLWARERGMREGTSLEDILLAQIEEHRSEVFYNLDPVRFGPSFTRRLPGHVRHRIAWRAAPSAGADLSGHDLLLCNFPSILKDYAAQGLKSAWFAPAHDPELEGHMQAERPIDLLFVGSYSRHHIRRAAVLEAVAAGKGIGTLQFHLDTSRLTRLAETPLGLLPPLAALRRPAAIRKAALGPVFGRQLYDVLGRAKIVLNGAVDMAGNERGNMRCFEALGSGALLLSDEGSYPDGMRPGKTLVTYRDGEDAAAIAASLLADPFRLNEIAKRGFEMLRERYSKARQWEQFQNLVAAL